MKKCTRCGEEKDESMFQIRKASKDGLTSACRKCLSDYDKSRANLPHRVAARNEYAATKNGIERSSAAKKRYIERNPIKRRAHVIVGNAIRGNLLFKMPCEKCGSTESVHAHHDDYAKPLNVRWLCAVHHKQWHNENGEAMNAS